MTRYENPAFFHPSFKEEPYWWEAFRPVELVDRNLPPTVDVAVVGGGYGGLSAALTLADLGYSTAVFEAGLFGSGASTRSGGAISSGLSVGKSITGKSLSFPPAILNNVLLWANEAFANLQEVIARENIACHYEKRGRYLGACAASHFDDLKARLSKLHANGITDCYLVTRDRQSEEINSKFYHGGMVFPEAAKLHPSLFYKGLLDACQRRDNIVLSGSNRVLSLARRGADHELNTEHGIVRARHVFVATNGYTDGLLPRLRRRLIPVASNIIATEAIPPELAKWFSPKGRTISETRRLLHYYRLSPDGKRIVFGGRTRYRQATVEEHATILRNSLIARFPELRDIRITHAWQGNVAFTANALPHTGEIDGVHYAVGCNGSGVSMMPYLGGMVARKIAAQLKGSTPFSELRMDPFPLYNGDPWFLPIAESYFRFRDYLDESRQ